MEYKKQTKRIECVDGASLSVQASMGHYCSPRTDAGPYSMVEVGFPSHKPQESMMEFAETPENPINTVYSWVPVEVVKEFIDLHGGFKGDGSEERYDDLIAGKWPTKEAL